jgi:chromosome segregation ATPase
MRDSPAEREAPADGGARAERAPELRPVRLDPRIARGAEPDRLPAVAAQLADSLVRALVVALRDLQRQKASEFSALSESVHQQQQKLDATIELLTDVKNRIEVLTEAVSEEKSAAQQKWEQLDTVMAALHEADARQEAAVSELRQETHELSVSVATSLDAVSDKLERHQQDITSVQSAFSELSATLAGLTARMDRQAEAIRTLGEEQLQRKKALEQLVESLLRLKTPDIPSYPVAEIPL